MAKIKCPYKYPARSREAKINFICGIGGYTDRDGRWPIEFCVGIYHADISFDHLWGKYREEYANAHPDAELSEFMAVAQKEYKRMDLEGSLYQVALEDCQRDIDKHWVDVYHQLWDGTPVDTELTLRGRQGKHLVLQHFGSLRLEGLREEELYETLTGQTGPDGEDVTDEHKLRRGFSWYYDMEFIDQFYRYCVQCARDFTPQNASLNLEGYAASNLFSVAEGAYTDYVENRESHEAVVGCAQTLRRYLAEREGSAVLQMLRTLSLAAGVSEEELDADI